MTAFAFLFPGQGSQSVGMLDAWGDHAAVRETLAEASSALGEDVAKLIREGPAEALGLTTNTQPVMLTAGIACYRAWLAEGGAQRCPGGHPVIGHDHRATRHRGYRPECLLAAAHLAHRLGDDAIGESEEALAAHPVHSVNPRSFASLVFTSPNSRR